MNNNGPDGTIFSLDNAALDQEHTLLFGLALLPPSRIIYLEHLRLMTVPPEGGDTKLTSTSFVGVNGGPEEAKKCVCEMIDKMWEQRC